MKLLKLMPAIALLFLVSCASDKPQGKTEAEVLYKEAKQLMEEGRFILATEKLNSLKNQYPYSYYATPAELLQADILYSQENFVEAAAAYMLFRDFHPKHEQLPYVIYKIAESYYKQIPDTFDRDLQGAIEAIKYYQEMLTKFPGSQYTKDAKSKISYCKKMLRSKEQYVADFYFKTEVFSAARWRYLDILNSFENKDLRNHSMIRVVESSFALKEFEKCVNYADQFLPSLSSNKDKSIVKSVRKNCQKKIK
jgi:outer membrane protein assembly factor BamD